MANYYLSFLVTCNIKGLDYRKKKHYLLVVKKHNVEQLNLGGDMRPGNLLILVLAAVLTASSCKESITENIVLVKSPLEMTWTVDTLAYPQSVQTLMSQICAFSKNNIYLVGWSGLVGGEMYRYDGQKWQNVDISPQIGGHRVNRLLGLSPTNIWGVGYQGENDLIVNYDGIRWKKESITTKGELYRVDGDSPNNIYALGSNSTIYYYNGIKWSYEKIRPNIPINIEFGWESVAVYKGTVLLVGDTRTANHAKAYMYQGKFNNWVLVDSLDRKYLENEKWGTLVFEKGENGKLFSWGNYFHEFTGEGWKRIPQPHIKNAGQGFYVYSDNYMISLARGVDYFDGKIWQSLPRFENLNNLLFQDAWSSGDELFIIANDFNTWPNRTIVFHGK